MNEIKNMTIKQLLNTDVIEEIDEAVKLLIKKMNELNNNSAVTYYILSMHYMGDMLKKPRSTLDDEEIEYDDLESPTWQPRKVIKCKGKCCEIKRDNNILYNEKGNDN